MWGVGVSMKSKLFLNGKPSVLYLPAMVVDAMMVGRVRKHDLGGAGMHGGRVRGKRG
jgi:hypothetical protein